MTSKPFVITRTFNAPRALVWDAFTKAEHLKHWMGPPGTRLAHCTIDLRPGGIFHYGMQSPDGKMMWGKWTLREVLPPEKLVVIVAFSDENMGISRHPMSETWPLETLSTTTFAEKGDKTVVRLEWSTYHATEAEQATFDSSHAGMNTGWSGTMDVLDTYLASQG